MIAPTDFLEDSPLYYVCDDDAGYMRLKWGNGFTYRDSEGNTIQGKERKRIESLAIPPAWREVWICPEPNGHILATGRDSEGRKQYIYHPLWEDLRLQHRFENLAAFAECLPIIREQIDAHLRKRNLTREKVLALVVKLLETTLIRIGNTYYTQRNESYGLTTMQDEHVAITGKRIQFEFTGKSGIEHEIELEQKRLAAAVRDCRDVPGQRLFQYYESDGTPQAIESGDVNEYLREITGADFTSKEFRTWGGSVYMIEVLSALPPPETAKEKNRQVVDAVKLVADHLGNTPAVARRHYIHPAVIQAYEDETLRDILDAQKEPDSPYDLDRYEKALVELMKT